FVLIPTRRSSVLLTFTERLHTQPIAASIDHPLIQHNFEQIITRIVMTLTNLIGPAPVLGIPDLRFKVSPDRRRSHHYFIFQIGSHYSGKEFIERLRTPPAIHIRLSQPQRTLVQYTLKQFFIVYLDIPRPIPVDLNIGSS